MTDAEFKAFMDERRLLVSERDELEERAAIHEFDGGLSREDAQQRACEEFKP